MNIQQYDDNKKGELLQVSEGKKLASMTYSYAGTDKNIIDLTEVDVTLKGQGVGYKLVEAYGKFARNKKIKIMPLCPFANAVFNKKSDYNDIRF